MNFRRRAIACLFIDDVTAQPSDTYTLADSTTTFSSAPQTLTVCSLDNCHTNIRPFPDWDAKAAFREMLETTKARMKELSAILTHDIRLLIGRPGRATVWFTPKLPAWSSRRWRSVT